MPATPAIPATLAMDDRSKNGDIEMLRAFAILFTLICHLNALFHGRDARSDLLARLTFWGGVDLFFCISGFVIATSLLHQPRAATFSQLGVPFWIRRIFRLWPAAALWLLIPLLCAKFFNVTGGFGHLRANLPGSGAALLQMENFYFIVCKDQPTALLQCGKADIYWSLSLEEQFYLVFPFLLFLLRERTLRAVLWILIAAQIFLSRPVESPLWFVRTDALCFGVLIALARRDGWLDAARPVLLKHRSAVMCAALLLLALIAAISVAPALRINAGLLAATSAGLIAIASLNANLIIPAPYLRAPMLWVGSRSYAIYLAHEPCMLATREIFFRTLHEKPALDATGVGALLTMAVLLVTCAELSFRFIESPFRALGRRIAGWWLGRHRGAGGAPPLGPLVPGREEDPSHAI
jgi:peptidoglycan/LPS O-acetylase OafA/YrhL